MKTILLFALSVLTFLSINLFSEPFLEELTFKNKELAFSGTLTLPDTLKKYPLIILITGSGPQTRDEDVLGFKIFKVLSDSLVKYGFAVYRYDDRGVGKSQGNFQTATTYDFADDANAALEMLYYNPKIDNKRIGLLGHSEGGLIAPIVYSKNPYKISFLILMAGTAVNGEKILKKQLYDLKKAENTNEYDLQLQVDAQRLMIDYVMERISKDSAMQDLKIIGKKQVAMLPDSIKSSIVDEDKYIKMQLENQLRMMRTPWMKEFLKIEPEDYLQKICIPTLALFGEKDLQVSPQLNIPIINNINSKLKQNNCPEITIKLIQNANHLFQHSLTGALTEYATNKKEFTNDFVIEIINWYKNNFKD